MKKIFIIAVCILVAIPGFSQCYALHCVNLLDVNSGQMKKEMTIVVDGNKISSIQKAILIQRLGLFN